MDIRIVNALAASRSLQMTGDESNRVRGAFTGHLHAALEEREYEWHQTIRCSALSKIPHARRAIHILRMALFAFKYPSTFRICHPLPRFLYTAIPYALILAGENHSWLFLLPLPFS